MKVFKEVIRRLQKTQRQSHPEYQKDRFIRDQIITCADLPEVEKSMREKVADTSQEAQQRIGNRLSDASGSAGSVIRSFFADEGVDAANYGIGRKFGGDARKLRLPYGVKRRGLRKEGCWVCGNHDHRARERHSPDEVRKAIEKHKSDGSYVYAESVASALATQDFGEGDCVHGGDKNSSEDSANVAAVDSMGNISFICGYDKQTPEQ
jgi:hypothetical protein